MKQDEINNGKRLTSHEARAQLLANPVKGLGARVALRGFIAQASVEAKAVAPHLAPRNPGKVRAL